MNAADSRKELNLLPEIRGPIKSIKQLLMADLKADGVLKNRIPFSYRRRQTGRGDSEASPDLGNDSQSNKLPFLKNIPSVSSIQSYHDNNMLPFTSKNTKAATTNSTTSRVGLKESTT